MYGSDKEVLAHAEAIPAVRSGDTFDVVVAGGGASGLMAAVSAARAGSKVLVVEASGCFGGAATNAMVAQWLGFYNGQTCAVGGLPIEYANRVIEKGGACGFEDYVLAEASANPLHLRRFPFNPEIVKLVADELVVKSGASALLHASVSGVKSSGGRIDTIEIQTCSGRKEVKALTFVDATGDAVVSRHAGAPLANVEDGFDRMGMSLCFRLSNVDVAAFRAVPRSAKRALALEGIAGGELFWDVLSVSPVGTSDAVCLMSHLDGLSSIDANELSRAELIGRYQVGRISSFLKRRMPGFERCELAGIANHIGVRETVRLEGDYVLTEDDVVNSRSFEDSVALGCGPLDIHEKDGKLRLFMPEQPFEIPMRTMTCSTVGNLIVTGRAMSATREANGAVRHQATAMALGQAAGHLASLATKVRGNVRDVSAAAVQQSLLRVGAMPSRSSLNAISGHREELAAA